MFSQNLDFELINTLWNSLQQQGAYQISIAMKNCAMDNTQVNINVTQGVYSQSGEMSYCQN